jgi:C-terminal processing protease CtpA/Prc
VTLDFPNRTLYLARGGHFSDADEPDMSGLHLIREGDKTLVYSVDAGSPAAAVGIETGDVLLSINSQNVGQMKMKDVRQRFKTKDGDKVTIEFTRGPQAQRVILTLTKSL